MSRSLRTMPYEIQKAKREKWRNICGYPPAYGGMNSGISWYGRIRNRKFRRLATVLLQKGEEIPVVKRQVAWDRWY